MDLKVLKQELQHLIAKFTKAKFAAVKTADGKVLSYEGDTPQMGMPVMIAGEGGAVSPAPDGEYALEGGGAMTVKEGKIIDLKQKPDKPKKPDDMTSEDVSTLISKILDEKMSAITADFGKQLNELKTAFETKFSEKDAAAATTAASMKAVEEKLEKEMNFSKEVLTLLEKIPDGEVKKPKNKNNKADEDPDKELRE